MLLLIGVGLIIWGLIGVLGDDPEPDPGITPTTVAEPAPTSGG